MAILTAAVILVGAIGLLNLVLLLGVIRRLREHSELLANQATMAPPQPILAAGERVGEFSASTVEGERISADSLPTRALVAFFSLNCSACREQLPKFVPYAKGVPGGRSQVLAVVVGEEDNSELLAALTPVAQVVEEPYGGALSQAFAVQGFPSFCWLDEGVATASGFDLQAVKESAPA